MAADKQVSAASRRRTRLSGWVLSQFQVTLAVCGIIVGFLVCFGLGFLSGVWFQTQEQMMPHDDAITLADNQLDRERKTSSPGREMTFYSALTSRDGTLASKLPPRAVTKPVPPPARQPQSNAASVAPSAMTSQSPALFTSEDAKPEDAKPEDVKPEEIKPEDVKPEVVKRPVAKPDQAALKEPQVETAMGQRLKPEETKLKQEAATELAGTSRELFYSIQVGSFRKVDQAYRLQDQLIKKGYQARIGLSMVEGKGAWYRVRVGRYANRGSADKTAQRLRTKEKIDVLVMRVSS